MTIAIIAYAIASAIAFPIVEGYTLKKPKNPYPDSFKEGEYPMKIYQ